MIKFLLRGFLCMLAALLAVNVLAADESSVKTNWGYKGDIGPAFWAKLDPDFALCAAGKEQSPIDIPRKNEKTDRALSFYYQAAPMKIVDDGVTELTLGDKQLLVKDGHGIQLNFAPDTRELIKLDGQQYQLLQFHFHSPSENQWRGRSFPMEIHFVHQGTNGKLAVVGVFVKAGKENDELQKIIDHLPKDHGREHVIKGERINPENFLPENWRYYQFQGSLTTPPCNEGVKWLVMENSITASPSQIAILRKAMNNGNARPIQPLNDRKVQYSHF